jgi:hypothetical protein
MKVAILWHMHQPSYWEADLGKYRYPWAFLHAARHYHMMGLLAKEHPETAMTINITPVLMEQLDDYAKEAFKDQLLDVVRACRPSTRRGFGAPRPVFKLMSDDDSALRALPRAEELPTARTRKSAHRGLAAYGSWYCSWTSGHLRRQPGSQALRRGSTSRGQGETVAGPAEAYGDPPHRELGSRDVEISTTPCHRSCR